MQTNELSGSNAFPANVKSVQRLGTNVSANLLPLRLPGVQIRIFKNSSNDIVEQE